MKTNKRINERSELIHLRDENKLLHERLQQIENRLIHALEANENLAKAVLKATDQWKDGKVDPKTLDPKNVKVHNLDEKNFNWALEESRKQKTVCITGAVDIDKTISLAEAVDVENV